MDVFHDPSSEQRSPEGVELGFLCIIPAVEGTRAVLATQGLSAQIRLVVVPAFAQDNAQLMKKGGWHTPCTGCNRG